MQSQPNDKKLAELGKRAVVAHDEARHVGHHHRIRSPRLQCGSCTAGMKQTHTFIAMSTDLAVSDSRSGSASSDEAAKEPVELAGENASRSVDGILDALKGQITHRQAGLRYASEGVSAVRSVTCELWTRSHATPPPFECACTSSVHWGRATGRTVGNEAILRRAPAGESASVRAARTSTARTIKGLDVETALPW